MKIIKNIWAQLHRFVFWAVILSIVWFWIYTFVGDAARDKKVVLYIDAYSLEERPLALRLEDSCLPEGIKMIQVRSFDYDMFGGALNGDIYLMKESIVKATLEESPEKLARIELPAGMTGYAWEGQICAIKVFDPADGVGPAMQYIRYMPYPATEPGQEPPPDPEPFYLCFDSATLHLSDQPGAVDNAAWEIAMALLAIDD